MTDPNGTPMGLLDLMRAGHIRCGWCHQPISNVTAEPLTSMTSQDTTPRVWCVVLTHEPCGHEYRRDVPGRL